MDKKIKYVLLRKVKDKRCRSYLKVFISNYFSSLNNCQITKISDKILTASVRVKWFKVKFT